MKKNYQTTKKNAAQDFQHKAAAKNVENEKKRKIVRQRKSREDIQITQNTTVLHNSHENKRKIIE